MMSPAPHFPSGGVLCPPSSVGTNLQYVAMFLCKRGYTKAESSQEELGKAVKEVGGTQAWGDRSPALREAGSSGCSRFLRGELETRWLQPWACDLCLHRVSFSVSLSSLGLALPRSQHRHRDSHRGGWGDLHPAAAAELSAHDFHS